LDEGNQEIDAGFWPEIFTKVAIKISCSN
jgi:hypothetical protein